MRATRRGKWKVVAKTFGLAGKSGPGYNSPPDKVCQHAVYHRCHPRMPVTATERRMPVKRSA